MYFHVRILVTYRQGIQNQTNVSSPNTRFISRVHYESPNCICMGDTQSAVGIVTGYRLDDRVVGVRVPVGQDFSPLHVNQIDSGALLASYRMRTGTLPSGLKRLGRDANH
jgi:hypothetical protein